MKANKIMRVASVLLVAVLLTTCAISSTFAKYVTTNSGADQATVAKFGVTINIEDDMGMFATEYAKEDNQYSGTLSVDSNASVGDNTDNRVAPGTKGQMSFSISGTPEVATRLVIDVTGAPIHLAPGTYTLPAGEFANAETTVTTTEDYEPIKFYFGEDAIDGDTVYDLTLADLKSEIDALDLDYDANANLAKTYYIGWSWAFEGTFEVDEENVANFLDTYLANEDTLQTETFGISISITQID